jgi:hypothetical protein
VVNPVTEQYQSLIASELDILEQREAVTVLYACESGSRAWGFASMDSDYDIRLVYVRPTRWYLSLNVERKREVIERMTKDKLDIVGWDLRKALLLLLKSNPSFLEWLTSPIVYRDRDGFRARLRSLAERAFSRETCAFHYLRWAQQNYKDYLADVTVSHKKYFYVLRPLLAVLWLERDYGMVPMEFSVLVERLINQQALREAIEQLLKAKRGELEMSRGPRIPDLHEFITTEFIRLEAEGTWKPVNSPLLEEFDACFYEVVRENNFDVRDSDRPEQR